MSIQNTNSAPANERTGRRGGGPFTSGAARRTRPKTPAGDGEPVANIVTSAKELPQAVNQSVTVAAQREAEAHGVAAHISVDHAVIEDLPAIGARRERQDPRREHHGRAGARRDAPSPAAGLGLCARVQPRREPQRQHPERRAHEQRAPVDCFSLERPADEHPAAQEDVDHHAHERRREEQRERSRLFPQKSPASAASATRRHHTRWRFCVLLSALIAAFSNTHHEDFAFSRRHRRDARRGCSGVG